MSYQQQPPGDEPPRADTGGRPGQRGEDQPGGGRQPDTPPRGRPDYEPPPGDGSSSPILESDQLGEPGYVSPEYGAPTVARSTVPFIIVGVLVVIAVAIGFLFFVNRGGGAGPSGSDPVASVRSFLSALKDKNCDQARSFLTGNATVQAEGTCDTGQLDRFRFTDPVLIHRSSVQASVNVKATTAGQSATLRLGLRKVDGKWLISDLNAD